MAASDVSAIPEVREFLLKTQRELACKNNIIMDGRDVGTVILPDAQVKIFLTAKPEERANRRCRELEEKGIKAVYTQVLDDINKRDYNDSTRAIAPLRKADDAVILDNTGLDQEKTVEEAYKIIRSKLS
jgi:cytidylate kinase